MSIFDRFFSREKGGEKKKPSSRTSNMRMSEDLDESAAQAKERYPEDRETIEDFMWAIKDARRTRRKKAGEGYMEPMNAEAKVFLSKDRMAAYACLLPPENDGEELTLESFLEDLHFEGIVHGVLEETIPEEFSRGYYHIFPVARGTLPRTGEENKGNELFRWRSRMRLDVQNGSEVDFSEENQPQPIRKGTVIYRFPSSDPGADGMDVTGAALSGSSEDSVTVSCGENVVTDESGQALIAATDGILYIEDNQLCIQEQTIIDGGLNQPRDALQVEGNLYIDGSVDGGASVKATGDIFISGKVGQARVTSTEGTVYVRQGICGREEKTFVTAAAQVQAQIIEWAQVNAGTSVIAETISNSSIKCGGTVYVMAGRGLIVTSQINAQNSILCQRVGNVTGGRSRFSVGYPPDIHEKQTAIRAEMTEAQQTVEQLWEPVLDLRRKGSRITSEEQALLGVLEEQRNLNLTRLGELKEEIRAVNQTLSKKCKGKIRCEQLYPVLEVQFGRLTEEIITREEKCNIRVEDGVILLQ